MIDELEWITEEQAKEWYSSKEHYRARKLDALKEFLDVVARGGMAILKRRS